MREKNFKFLREVKLCPYIIISTLLLLCHINSFAQVKGIDSINVFESLNDSINLVSVNYEVYDSLGALFFKPDTSLLLNIHLILLPQHMVANGVMIFYFFLVRILILQKWMIQSELF